MQSMFGGQNAIGKTIIDVKLVKVALYTQGTTFYEPTSQYFVKLLISVQ